MPAQSPIDPNQFADRTPNANWNMPYVASPNTGLLPQNPGGTMGPAVADPYPNASMLPARSDGQTMGPQQAASTEPQYTTPWASVAPSPSNLPNGSTAPFANPVGSQDGINANWAFLTSTKYNPQTNSNLQATYEEQMRQFQANGGKRWVGTVDNGHWDTTPPPPPVYTSTDYNQNLAWTNANTPGQPGYGQADASFMAPFTQNDPIYASTLTPWSTSNTNLAKVYETQLPQDGKVPTVSNPNGWLPTQQGFSPNETYPGDPASNFVPRTTPYDGPQSTPTQYIGGTGANAAGNTGAPAVNPTDPNSGGAAGNSSLMDLLGLISLLGGGQKQDSPFFNNNRSLFYPNTNRESVTTTPNPSVQAGRQTNGGINLQQLLTALLGGR